MAGYVAKGLELECDISSYDILKGLYCLSGRTVTSDMLKKSNP